MATIKSYTDISQSKKLAEILPLESADMFYVAGKGEPIFIGNKMVAYGDDDYDALGESDVLCWSLAALLDVLPFPVLYMEMLGGMILWCCECHLMETGEVVKIENFDNPIDACYEVIIKLYELKML